MGFIGFSLGKYKGEGLAYHIIEKYISILSEFSFKKGKTIENMLKIFISVLTAYIFS